MGAAGSGFAPPDVQLAGRNRHVHRAALAVHEHQHRCAFGVFVHSRLEVVYRANGLTIDLDDHVTGADAGLAGAAPLNDVTHQHTLVHFEAELAGDRRGERLNRETQLALALDPGDLGQRFVLEPGDPRGEPYLFALPHHHHRHLAAHPCFGDEARQVRGLRNLVPGKLHDYVPGFHTGLLRRGALHHGRDQCACSVGALEALRELLGEGLDRHTEPAALDLTVRGELRNNRLGHARGHREAATHRPAALADDRGVDTDNLPSGVDQRTTAIPRVDGGVGLNEVVVRPTADHSTGRAYDPGGDRLLEAERVADSHHRLADLERIRIPDGDDREPSGLDLQKGQVCLGIAPDYRGGQLTVVRQLHLDAGRILDDMVGGHDVAVRGQDEARSDGAQ